MARRIDGVAVAAVGVGSMFAYAGIKDKSFLSILTGLIHGQDVTTASSANAGLGTVAPAGLPLTGSGTGAQPGVSAVRGAYSPSQLQSLWVMAGGAPGKAAVASCIAQHESGGNAGVTSANPDGGTNVGLWQLDTPGGKGAGYTVAQLQNPLTNARVAIAGSSNGADWSAWATAPDCGV
jgi:Lysozyme like domain